MNLTEFILSIDAWVWRPSSLPVVLLVVGGLMTVLTGFVQIRRFPLVVRMVLRGAFKKDISAEGLITPFQALSTALAATVGNGNIGGVATAILIGGPGAVFWMWASATVGMATKFAEAVLGVHYRSTTAAGELAAGPMYYIKAGLPRQGFGKAVAFSFALFGAATALIGTGNMAQSNTVARTFVQAARTVFHVNVPYWIPGLLISVTVGLVLVGGIRRIAAVTEKMVPTMIVIYVVAGTLFILLNIEKMPGVLAEIFRHAFTPTAALGGFAGASVSAAVAAGTSRGVLSNEAGLGSAPIAHGVAQVKHPVEQGLVGVFEVFLDTFVVCSMTAMIILGSGLWTDPSYRETSGDLTAAAMGTSIPFAALIVAVSSFLFGFSTLIGWCYYGEKCFEYLFGSKGIVPYRVAFTVLAFCGSVVSVPLVWALGTLLNGFMAFPNLVGLLFLGGTVRRLTRDYFSKRDAS